MANPEPAPDATPAVQAVSPRREGLARAAAFFVLWMVLMQSVKPGDLVVLVGSGVGHNQAGIALRITDDLVRKAS